jgi:hypothetical protein
MKCKNILQYRIVTINHNKNVPPVEQGVEADASRGEQHDEEEMVTDNAECSQDVTHTYQLFIKFRLLYSFCLTFQGDIPHVVTGQEENRLESGQWSPDEYHERLTILSFDNIDEVEKFYSENFQTLNGDYGVLSFLYTVLLTKVLNTL